MIKCDRGKVEFEGRGADILAELCILIKALINGGVADAEMMHRVVDTAMLCPEELEREMDKALSHILCQLLGLDTGNDRVQEMMEVVNRIKNERRS